MTQYFVIKEKRPQNVVVNDVLIISNKFLRVNKKMCCVSVTDITQYSSIAQYRVIHKAIKN